MQEVYGTSYKVGKWFPPSVSKVLPWIRIQPFAWKSEGGLNDWSPELVQKADFFVDASLNSRATKSLHHFIPQISHLCKRNDETYYCTAKYFEIQGRVNLYQKRSKIHTKDCLYFFLLKQFFLRSRTSEFPSNNYSKKSFLHLNSENFAGTQCTATALPPFHESPVTLPGAALKEEKTNFHSNIKWKYFKKTVHNKEMHTI